MSNKDKYIEELSHYTTKKNFAFLSTFTAEREEIHLKNLLRKS